MARWSVVLRYLEVLLLFIPCIAGLLGFILVPLSLGLIAYYGGSAINGYRKEDQYFLVDHGKASEVTGTVYHRMLMVEKAAITCVLVVAFTSLLIFLVRKLKRD